MTTTIGMHYEVIAGKEEEFETGFSNVLKHLATVAGHVESHLYEDVSDTGSYMILSQWDSKQSFEKFIHSPEFASVVAWGRAEICAKGPRTKFI